MNDTQQKIGIHKIGIHYVGGGYTVITGIDADAFVEWLQDDSRTIQCIVSKEKKQYIFKDKICFVEIEGRQTE